METTLLPNTSLYVSPISIGGAHVQRHQVYEYGVQASEAASLDSIDFALAQGINFIDTAPLYRDSEEVIGRALHGRRQHVVLSTKVGCLPGRVIDSRDEAWRSIEQSLARLQTDHVEILFLHSLQDDQSWSSLLGPDKIMTALLEAREQGVARYLGISGTKTAPLMEAMRSGLFAVAMTYYEYNLLTQRGASVIQEAERLKMGVLNGGPLCGGLLNGDRPEQMDARRRQRLSPSMISRIEQLIILCRQSNYPLPQLNLRFSLAARFASTILGMRNRAEVQAALDALEIPPPEALWSQAMQLASQPMEQELVTKV